MSCNNCNSNELIYYVYNKTTGYTKKEHYDINEAKKEAERLFIKNPQDQFYILKKVSECKYSNIIWIDNND